jgi:peptidoglycan/xylan/chitin deacetylase (PgdA/CDA1 family)
MRSRPALVLLIIAAAIVIGSSAVLNATSDLSSAGGASTSETAAPANDGGEQKAVEPVKDVPLLTLPDPLPNRVLNVPILMYHRIAVLRGDEPQVTVGLTVDPGEFLLQMSWLHDQGYTTISQLQLYRALEEGAPLPEKPIMLTFDDGYRGVATVAAPMMSKFGFIGTAYVITDRIAKSKKAAPTWMTWSQLRILEQRGWDIGSHTVSHTELPGMSEEDALQTLRRSRSTLERNLGHPVQWFCYPAGAVDDTSVDWVRQAGYVLATTTESGDTLSARDPLRLQRIRISNATDVRGLAAALS